MGSVVIIGKTLVSKTKIISSNLIISASLWAYNLKVEYTAHNGQNVGSSPTGLKRKW